VSGLQAGLTQARYLVLVCGPETFGSPWVCQELDTFQALHPHWRARGLLQVVLLVDTPLPPFLASTQHVDFREHDENRYIEGLRALVAALKGLRDPESLRLCLRH
jgi:hypothetical protein